MPAAPGTAGPSTVPVPSAGFGPAAWRPRVPFTLDGVRVDGSNTGRFIAESEIGLVATGALFAGRDEDSNRAVSLLLFHPAFFTEARRHSQIIRLMRALRYDQAHVAPTFAVGEAFGTFFVAAAPIIGQPLTHWRRDAGRLAVADVYRLVGQLIEGVAAIHAAGGVHGSLSPDTLRVVGDDAWIVNPWTLDQAVDLPPGELPPPRSSWLAPELLFPDAIQGAETDVYGLGLALGYLLACGLTEPGHSLLVQGIDVPPAVDDVYVRATARQREARYRDLAELSAALEAAAGYEWRDAQKILPRDGAVRSLAIEVLESRPVSSAADEAEFTDGTPAVLEAYVHRDVESTAEDEALPAFAEAAPTQVAGVRRDAGQRPEPLDHGADADGEPIGSPRTGRRRLARTLVGGSPHTAPHDRPTPGPLTPNGLARPQSTPELGTGRASASLESLDAGAIAPGGPPPLPPRSPTGPSPRPVDTLPLGPRSGNTPRPVEPPAADVNPVAAVLDLPPPIPLEPAPSRAITVETARPRFLDDAAAAPVAAAPGASAPPVAPADAGATSVPAGVSAPEVALTPEAFAALSEPPAETPVPSYAAPVELHEPTIVEPFAPALLELDVFGVARSGPAPKPPDPFVEPPPPPPSEWSDSPFATPAAVGPTSDLFATSTPGPVADRPFTAPGMSAGALALGRPDAPISRTRVERPPAVTPAPLGSHSQAFAAAPAPAKRRFPWAIAVAVVAGVVVAILAFSWGGGAKDRADAGPVAATNPTSATSPAIVPPASPDASAVAASDANASDDGALLAALTAADDATARGGEDALDQAGAADAATLGGGDAADASGADDVATSDAGRMLDDAAVAAADTAVTDAVAAVDTTVEDVAVAAADTAAPPPTDASAAASDAIAAGDFVPKDPAKLTCPGGMAKLKKKVEVVLASGAKVEDWEVVCIDLYEYPGAGSPPRTNVDISGARAACMAKSKRLCTRSEWRRACGGTYPYGATYDATKCASAGDDGSPGSVVAAGSKKGCRSPSGAYDMVGNVAEWTADGTVNGGSAFKNAADGTCNTGSKRAGGAPYVGFRCCADAK